jgi:hypothetical protein
MIRNKMAAAAPRNCLDEEQDRCFSPRNCQDEEQDGCCFAEK